MSNEVMKKSCHLLLFHFPGAFYQSLLFKKSSKVLAWPLSGWKDVSHREVSTERNWLHPQHRNLPQVQHLDRSLPFKVSCHVSPTKVQSLLHLGRCYAGVLQPVQLPPQPLHHLLHQQCHEVSPQVKSQTIKMVIGQVHLGGAVLHHLQHSSQPQGLTNLTGASSQGTLYSF